MILLLVAFFSRKFRADIGMNAAAHRELGLGTPDPLLPIWHLFPPVSWMLPLGTADRRTGWVAAFSPQNTILYLVRSFLYKFVILLLASPFFSSTEESTLGRRFPLLLAGCAGMSPVRNPLPIRPLARFLLKRKSCNPAAWPIPPEKGKGPRKAPGIWIPPGVHETGKRRRGIEAGEKGYLTC